MKKAQGFTLIEILVSFAVLVLIIIASSNIFFALLRGSTKTKTMQIIKQNGDYCLSIMARMIRNARNISPVDVATDSITITNPDGENTTFSCQSAGERYAIASNSSSLVSSDVTVGDCARIFTVTSGVPGIRPAVVDIEFDLKQAATTTRPEEQALVHFKTTVSLRNY